jgi:hypothetical protein
MPSRLILLVSLLCLVTACRQDTPPPTKQIQPASSPTSAPNPAPVVIHTPPPKPPPPKPAEPKRPKIDWVIFRSAVDEKADALCDARWTGDKRFELKTDNINRITVDLTRLPEGAPAKGPYNFQIDGQGIELTGFRSKRIDLIRSQNGIWSVDKDAPAYRDSKP